MLSRSGRVAGVRGAAVGTPQIAACTLACASVAARRARPHAAVVAAAHLAQGPRAMPGAGLRVALLAWGTPRAVNSSAHAAVKRPERCRPGARRAPAPATRARVCMGASAGQQTHAARALWHGADDRRSVPPCERGAAWVVAVCVGPGRRPRGGPCRRHRPRSPRARPIPGGACVASTCITSRRVPSEHPTNLDPRPQPAIRRKCCASRLFALRRLLAGRGASR